MVLVLVTFYKCKLHLLNPSLWTLDLSLEVKLWGEKVLNIHLALLTSILNYGSQCHVTLSKQLTCHKTKKHIIHLKNIDYTTKVLEKSLNMWTSS